MMKKIYLWVFLLILVIVFAGLYKFNYTNDDINRVSSNRTISKHGDVSKKTVLQEEDSVVLPKKGNPEKGITAGFSGEVLILSEKLLAPHQSESCQKSFKSGEKVSDACVLDEVVFMKRVDEESFPSNLYAIQGDDVTKMIVGCKTKKGDLFRTNYGKVVSDISFADMKKIVESINKDALYVNLTKKVYDAYSTDNDNCAVSWSVLTLGKKEVIEK